MEEPPRRHRGSDTDLRPPAAQCGQWHRSAPSYAGDRSPAGPDGVRPIAIGQRGCRDDRGMGCSAGLRHGSDRCGVRFHHSGSWRRCGRHRPDRRDAAEHRAHQGELDPARHHGRRGPELRPRGDRSARPPTCSAPGSPFGVGCSRVVRHPLLDREPRTSRRCRRSATRGHRIHPGPSLPADCAGHAARVGVGGVDQRPGGNRRRGGRPARGSLPRRRGADRHRIRSGYQRLSRDHRDVPG